MTFEFVEGPTLEETKASLRKFIEQVFDRQLNIPPMLEVVVPMGQPMPPVGAAISISSRAPVAPGTPRFQPKGFTSVDFSVNVHEMWWETVRDDFADLLPDEEAAIVMLGGSRCPQLGIVRAGRRTFHVHHRGKQVADITSLIQATTPDGWFRRGVDQAGQVGRAQWLAEHLGCGYGREKRQRTWRKPTRRGR